MTDSDFMRAFATTTMAGWLRLLWACLIRRLWKAWPANQALASQSSVRKGQRVCLMFLLQLSLAEAFFLFDSQCGAWPKGN
jgi:hypothetical protein